MAPNRLPVVSAVLAAVLAVALHAQEAPVARPAPPPPPPPPLYVGHEAEIEEFLRTAEVVKYKDVSLGVTRPSRVWFAPGGPVASVAWKPLKPGVYRGFYESYKSEIAAYEMSKLLELNMVPPAVERKLNGLSGAAVMWLEDMRMWRDLEDEKPASLRWNVQMVQMKMFDSFIGNIDRNAGNILIDDHWTVYLIDHSRAFVTTREPPLSLNMVDRRLWTRMQALDEAQLQEAIGGWISTQAIKAILARRERMAKAIEKIIEKRGQRAYLPGT